MIPARKARTAGALVALLAALAVSGCRRVKYDNPITKDSQQPDKILFDKAIDELERRRYSQARLLLNTMMNTYDTSEYMAKAKLALADSWLQEGGANGMAQARAEFKDFILFYPMMEEAAEAQFKICEIEYDQMQKPDRDATHALTADEECRNLLLQFPNSKFAPVAQQKVREVQEVLAESEFRVGNFYHGKGSYWSSTNRLETMVNHYPLYSKADQALWLAGRGYAAMGPRFREKTAEMYARIVRDYPLSPLVDDARKELRAMEKEIPEADPVALARMQYELANRDQPGFLHSFFGIFRTRPDTYMAAKSGNPALSPMRPTVPVSVPSSDLFPGAGTAEVTVSTVDSGDSALDTLPDARQNPPAGQQPAPTR